MKQGLASVVYRAVVWSGKPGPSRGAFMLSMILTGLVGALAIYLVFEAVETNARFVATAGELMAAYEQFCGQPGEPTGPVPAKAL